MSYGYGSMQPSGYNGVNGYRAPSPEGQSHANVSLVFGILGILMGFFVFGIVAVVYAKKAATVGVDATPGKVMGWIGIVLGGIYALIILFFIFLYGALAFSSVGA